MGDPGHRQTDHWSEWEDSEEERAVDLEDLDESELEQTALEHIRERTDEMWTIQAVIHADSDPEDGSMSLLVVRSGVGDEGLLLDERYFRLDPTDPWRDATGYSGNGITRVVSEGSLPTALAVAYKACADGLHEGKTQALRLDGDKLEHDSETLTESFAEVLGVADRLGDPSKRSVEGAGETVTCEECGEEIPRSEAENFGGGVVDLWVHEGSCPGEGGEA